MNDLFLSLLKFLSVFFPLFFILMKDFSVSVSLIPIISIVVFILSNVQWVLYVDCVQNRLFVGEFIRSCSENPLVNSCVSVPFDNGRCIDQTRGTRPARSVIVL